MDWLPFITCYRTRQAGLARRRSFAFVEEFLCSLSHLAVRIVALSMFAQAAHAEYTVSLLCKGSTSATIRAGQTFDLDVMLSSDNFDVHDSAILRLEFSAGGLQWESCAWTAPFMSGGVEDDSKPAKSQLPSFLSDKTLQGEGYPADVVDLELSNVAAGGDVPPIFGMGRLARLTFLVPLDYSGPATISISAKPDTFARGAEPVRASASESFQLKVRRDFRAWQERFFGSSESSSSLADADRDGSNNLVEYAFAMPPKSATPRDHLPAAFARPQALVLRYTRPAYADDLVYTHEISTDLKAWKAARDGVDYLVESIPSVEDGTTIIQLRFSVSAGGALFTRVRLYWTP